MFEPLRFDCIQFSTISIFPVNEHSWKCSLIGAPVRVFSSCFAPYESWCQICTFERMRPAKIQTSLRIRAVWSESSLGAFWIAKTTKFLHADNEDWSDYTDLNLRWLHMSEGRFSVVAVRLWTTSTQTPFAIVLCFFFFCKTDYIQWTQMSGLHLASAKDWQISLQTRPLCQTDFRTHAITKKCFSSESISGLQTPSVAGLSRFTLFS